MCAKCGVEYEDGDNEETNPLLLCDGCDAAWHIKCLSPQLPAVPDGDWFCPACASAATGAGAAATGAGAADAVPAATAARAAAAGQKVPAVTSSVATTASKQQQSQPKAAAASGKKQSSASQAAGARAEEGVAAKPRWVVTDSVASLVSCFNLL